MKEHALDPQLTRDETTEVVEGLVTGWSIPEEVPQGINTIVIPDSECPTGARFGARALHTLVLRSRPRTLIVVTADLVPSPRMQTMGQVETALGSCSIDERLSARIASELGDHLEVFPRLENPLQSLQRMTPLLCQVLAPGCRFIPIVVPIQSSDPDLMIQLGQLLGSTLSAEHGACLVAGLNLPTRQKIGSASDLTDDAALIRHLLDPNPKSFLEASLLAQIESFAPALIALGHSQARQCSKGFLLEHGELIQGDSHRGAASVVL
ncbi:MAG: hypothetical protein CBC13_10880 [Planctomycetia bacterium TMED53]|nr:MAG: hypothetical protein CBC13_10880 [Planctomycetia bacterium TMED53]